MKIILTGRMTSLHFPYLDCTEMGETLSNTKVCLFINSMYLKTELKYSGSLSPKTHKVNKMSKRITTGQLEDEEAVRKWLMDEDTLKIEGKIEET